MSGRRYINPRIFIVDSWPEYGLVRPAQMPGGPNGDESFVDLGWMSIEEWETVYYVDPVPVGPAAPFSAQPGGRTISRDMRWAVWERDDFTCQRCGARRRLSIDHIIPRSKGGTDDLANLQTLCSPCNSGKRDR